MVLQERTLRLLSLLTFTSTAWIAHTTLFTTTYKTRSGRDHVFSDLQRWYTSSVSKVLGLPETDARGGAAPGTGLQGDKREYQKGRGA